MTDTTKLVDPAVDDVNKGDEAAPLIKQLDVHAGLLRLAVSQTDKKLVSRVLGHLPSLVKKSLDLQTLVDFYHKYSSSDEMTAFVQLLPLSKTDVVDNNSSIVELYAWTLLIALWNKERRYEQVEAALEKALSIVQKFHDRVFDPILAKLYTYWGLAGERMGKLVDLRHHFMLALRSCSLRHDTETYAVVYNWILRSFVLCDQHDLAKKFVDKSPFPLNANNAQICRYHYYMARIAAVQMDYEESAEHLVQALRKAPHADSCLGLVQTCNKLLVIVQLLLGNMPERSLFSQPKLSKSLYPYLLLTKVVHLGDLNRFQQVVNDNRVVFTAHRNFTLVTRLHENVLRTGLKRINLAYSRIPISEISSKLGLPSVDDAEFVVMKAIKENVIKATIDHAGQFVQSNSTIHSYYTREPQAVLDQRIKVAQDVYKQSVRALRYPQGASKLSSTGNDFEAISKEAEDLEAFMDADDDGMDF